MKKFLCVLMSAVIALSCAVCALAYEDPDWIAKLANEFIDEKGPEVDGIVIDYVSYTPRNLKKSTKYPLVILLHGMGQGGEPREQIEDNYFPAFASEKMQAKFTNGAAFFMIPRSDESKDAMGTWTDDEVRPLYETIQDFIARHKSNIDLTRIYIGGYSMGGKMTLKMLSTYPGMFAAAFPMCPAYIPSDDQLKAIADIPLWFSCSKFDILAGYYVYGREIWEKVCDYTNRPQDCRMSVIGKVCLPDGKKADSNHHVWFAASNDMFTYENGDYPNMVTTDATGKTVKLTAPDGLISWLCRYKSAYGGEKTQGTNLVEQNSSTVFDMLFKMLGSLRYMFRDTLKTAFSAFAR
ncbi:MAG: hypothetical protein IJK60_00025 [Clostridia bacterium]|nr:hypothetical protein [Clostridia bacterium]